MTAAGLLFEDAPATKQRAERPNFWNLIAIDRGQPDGWRWFKWERIGEGDHVADIVEGGVATEVYESGPRKGKLNYAKATHLAKLVITRAEICARIARWEAETGKCSGCGGDGEEVAGWSKDHGTEYRPCSRCKATGKAPEVTL